MPGFNYINTTNLTTQNGLLSVFDYANEITGYLFGGYIVFLVWIVALIWIYGRSPRMSFAVAGFAATLTAMLLKLTLTTFADWWLFTSIGAMSIGILMAWFMPKRYG